MTTKRHRSNEKHVRTIVAVTAIGLALVATAVFITLRGGGSGNSLASLPTVPIHLDYPTYSSEAALRADADVIVRGIVIDEGTLSREDPPLTDYNVQVQQTYKGYAPNSLIVAMTGGVTSKAKFVAEGVPALVKGKSDLFYLKRGNDGKYYPLAGSTAVGVEVAPNVFELSRFVTGSSSLRLDASKLHKDR